MAMGPLAVFDLAGNDIGYRIRKEVSSVYGWRFRGRGINTIQMQPYYPYKPENVKGRRGETWVKLADDLCARERFGQKVSESRRGRRRSRGRETGGD